MCVTILPALNLKVPFMIPSMKGTPSHSQCLSQLVELKDLDFSTYIMGQAFTITYSQQFVQDQSQHVD